MECAVCGSPVHQYEQITTNHETTDYYFCSDEHKEEFESLSGEFTK